MPLNVKTYVDRLSMVAPFLQYTDESKTGSFTFNRSELEPYGIITPEEIKEFIRLLQSTWNSINGAGSRYYRIIDSDTISPEIILLKWDIPALTKAIHITLTYKLEKVSYDRAKITDIFELDQSLYRLAITISNSFIDLGASPESFRVGKLMTNIIDDYVDMVYTMYMRARNEFPSYNGHPL